MSNVQRSFSPSGEEDKKIPECLGSEFKNTMMRLKSGKARKEKKKKHNQRDSQKFFRGIQKSTFKQDNTIEIFHSVIIRGTSMLTLESGLSPILLRPTQTELNKIFHEAPG